VQPRKPLLTPTRTQDAAQSTRRVGVRNTR
jgi:hypothetical protein